MSWAISANTLPTITSYADCDSFFNSIKATRTGEKDIVYLATHDTWSQRVMPLNVGKNKWSDKTKRIEQGSNYYKLWYHKTDVVTYYKDGRITLDYSRGGRSTRTFLHELTSRDIWVTDKVNTMWYVVHGKWYSVSTNSPLRINADGTVSRGKGYNYTKEIANRAERRKIRQQLKAFTQWFKALTNCTGSILPVVAEVEDAEVSSSDIGLYLDRVLDGSTVDKTWRFLSLAARKSVDGWTWISSTHEDKYGFHNAASMLRKINEIAWNQHDGWKKVKVQVAPGEEP